MAYSITKDNGRLSVDTSKLYDTNTYSLLKTIAVQDITATETGELLPNVFPTIEVGNGEYIQDIIIQMAKDATAFDKTTFFCDKTINKPEFKEMFHDTWNKFQYNIGYNRKDLANQLVSGKSEEEIKSTAVGQLAKKKDLDATTYLEQCITDTTNKVSAVYNASTNPIGVPTFTSIASTDDLKVVPQQIRNVINYLARFNNCGIAYSETSGGVTTYPIKTGLSKDDIVVCMSESCSNILDTFMKTGIYNLQYLYDNYNVVLLPDSDLLALASGVKANAHLDRIYIMDKRHIINATRDEVVESQYDAPTQTFGVFYTLDKMYGTSKLFKAVYFDCANVASKI